MLEVIAVAGDYVAAAVWHRIIQIVTNHKDLQVGVLSPVDCFRLLPVPSSEAVVELVCWPPVTAVAAGVSRRVMRFLCPFVRPRLPRLRNCMSWGGGRGDCKIGYTVPAGFGQESGVAMFWGNQSAGLGGRCRSSSVRTRL